MNSVLNPVSNLVEKSLTSPTTTSTTCTPIVSGEFSLSHPAHHAAPSNTVDRSALNATADMGGTKKVSARANHDGSKSLPLSGISLLRLKVDAATPVLSRTNSYQNSPISMSRSGSQDALETESATSSDSGYEVHLQNDFYSDEAALGTLPGIPPTAGSVDMAQVLTSDAGMAIDDTTTTTTTTTAASAIPIYPNGTAPCPIPSVQAATRFDHQTPVAAIPQTVPETPVHGGRKMTADDFEPLRCLGKGSFGTVLLVKQKNTGKLYAQKQFKKASLIVHKKLVEQTKTERQILELVNRHPFVVKLYYAFQDRAKLYLILEYGQGGELFTHLNTEKMFPEPVAAFYMAEMLLAIAYLHDTLGVIYRDLKPENCLLDADGHLLLTDFGLSKVSVETAPGTSDGAPCNSMLGTVDYMAPEIVQGVKYGKAVDWWSFGALGFDLLTGMPPFRGANNAKIMDNIVKQKLSVPYYVSADAKDLLNKLLRKDPAKRLGGNMPKDLQAMKAHRFFRKIHWKKLAARDMEPPIQPLITDPELAENFDPEFTEMCLSPVISSAPWGDLGTSPSGQEFGPSPGHGPSHGRSHSRHYSQSHGPGHGRRDSMFGGFSFVAPPSLLNGEVDSWQS